MRFFTHILPSAIDVHIWDHMTEIVLLYAICLSNSSWAHAAQIPISKIRLLRLVMNRLIYSSCLTNSIIFVFVSSNDQTKSANFITLIIKVKTILHPFSFNPWTTRESFVIWLSSHVVAVHLSPSPSILCRSSIHSKILRSTNKQFADFCTTPISFDHFPHFPFDLSRNFERETEMESDVPLIEIAEEDDSLLQLIQDDNVSSSNRSKSTSDDAIFFCSPLQPRRSKPVG